MHILIVAATAPEVEPLANSFGNRLDVLITGAGMVPTAFALGRQFNMHKYNLVINLGIAGSFDKNIPLGDVVEITKDTFAELGAEDDTRFINIEQLGLGASIFNPTSSLVHFTKKISLPKVSAITVNTVHGNEGTIAEVANRVKPQLESMEGAAFFYACRELKVPCVQIRAVSNYVEKRNRDNWQIGLAVKNLNTFALDLLKEL